MATSITEILPEVKAFRFILESGVFKGKRFKACLSADCLNPLCACADAKVSAVEEESGNTYTFYMTSDKTLSSNSKHGKSMTEEEKTLGHCFAEELDDDQWNGLLQFVFQQKLAETNKITDFESLEIDFSNEEFAIEQESLCILYNRLFPFAEAFRTKHNGKTYLFSDQYCVNSNCTCHDVLLSIADISDADKKTAEPISVITYDYLTGVWSLIDDYGEEQSEIEEMMTANKSVLQKIGKTCKDRHRTMRTIYGNYRERTQGTLPFPITKKAGRNDPCPCGSGMKYKKCCGR